MADSVNPCPPDGLDEGDNLLLRGDAIGETAYTHRWILKCLLTITEGLPKYVKQQPHINVHMNDNISINQGNDSSETFSNSSATIELEQEDQPNNVSTENEILELESNFEDAACQLWDMTVERDVSLHLFSLEEIDILHLASVVIEDSKAPRLTEVMVGIVANLCCQTEVCEKVLRKEEESSILLSALQLFGSTNDVPTLCEVMRLFRLLLWHRIHRSPKSSWASCPLLKLLCQDCYRDAVSFLINNSLSDALITSLLEFLTNFLFVSLPETGLSIASLYSEKEIIDGLIDILTRKKCYIVVTHISEDQEIIIHFVVMCLYAFIDTPGSRLIQLNGSSENSTLESVLLSYLEREARVESLEELIGDPCEHISRVVGLTVMLIPYIKSPTIILTISKVIALIQGETLQYSVNKSTLDELKCNKNIGSWDIISAASEDIELDRTRRRRSSEKDGKRVYKSQYSNPSSEEFGWNSPPPSLSLLVQPGSIDSPSVLGTTTTISPHSSSFNEKQIRPRKTKEHTDSRKLKLKPNVLKELEELRELLEEYCFQLLSYWWSDTNGSEEEVRAKTQTIILDALDQCHAHELLHVLRAVRQRDPTLVPKLQEQILDSGSHSRLVALLAHMYQ